MAEMIKSKRVIFPKGMQGKFLIQCKNKLGMTHAKFSEFLGITARTLTYWQCEKFSVPLNAIRKISKKIKLRHVRGIQIKEPYWYVHKAARAGGLAVIKKYGHIGSSRKRKEMWYKWWHNEGKMKSCIGKSKPIRIPPLSRNLAEFVGIVLGDGGITKSQLTVTLDYKTEKKYSRFVADLMDNLFGIKPSVNVKNGASAINIVISRIRLVAFCRRLGLAEGNKIKHQVDIPTWIKKNKFFEIACLRGLIDTDGCIFLHRYNVNGKEYSYKKLSFTSFSKPLRMSVYRILQQIGFYPRLSQNRDVRLDRQEDVVRYFNIVGTNNFKHHSRFIEIR